LIHIVRVWMDGQNHYIIGDDREAIEQKLAAWKALGGRVLSHTTAEGELGMVITRRASDREHISEIEDTGPRATGRVGR